MCVRVCGCVCRAQLVGVSCSLPPPPPQNHALPGVAGNNIHHSHVCNIRILYREECLRRELNLLAAATGEPMNAPTSPYPIPDPVADGSWRCDLDALQKLADRQLR